MTLMLSIFVFKFSFVAQSLGCKHDVAFGRVIDFVFYGAIQGLLSAMMKFSIGFSPPLLVLVMFLSFSAILSAESPLGALLIFAPPSNFLLIGFSVYTLLVIGYVCFLFFVVFNILNMKNLLAMIMTIRRI